MSQSPVQPADDAAGAYRSAWSALNKLLRLGYSWSGREQNCAFLNLAGRGFANVSAASGFDFADDGRAMALVDWDGDGDEDVFTTNRTSPRVRFLRNDQGTRNSFVTLELEGTRTNRNGIGARVELELRGGRRLVRGLRAGEGYLAQSSGRLTIGLGPEPAAIEHLFVRWPGGAREEFRGVAPRQGWRLVEGTGQGSAIQVPRAGELAGTAPTPAAPPKAVRVPLVRALPLPRLALTASDGTEIELFGIQPGGKGTGTGKVLLLQLFSPTCAPCVTELTNFAQQSAELTRAKLAPLAVSTTAHAERAAASELLARVGWPHPWASAAPQSLEVLDALVATLLDREQRLAVPVSFLIDPEGALRVLYLGPVEPAQVLSDVALCELGEGALFDRAAPFAGRWMFPGLAEDADLFEGRLRERGLEDAAAEFARGRLTVVRTTPADLLQDFARNSVAAGNLGEAEKYFRRALAGDPRHFGALFDLAVLLHKQERLQEASELYGKALALQPENADARFNLALVRIALGDRPGAERELRWLKAHGAESAEVLADVLANAK